MKPDSRRIKAAGIVAVWVVLLLGLYAASFHHPGLLKLELYSQDLRSQIGRPTPLNPQLVLLAIDQPSYQDYFSAEERNSSLPARLLSGPFPWSREIWALAINKLAEAGAKVVAIDLVFGTPGPGDDALKAALEKYQDRVVVGCNLTASTTDRGGMGALVWPTGSVLSGADTNVNWNDARVGFVNIFPDADEICRRALFRISYNQTGGLIPAGESLESFSARILRQSGYASAIPPGFQYRQFRFTDAASQEYAKVPLATIFNPKAWHANYADGRFFQDKIVLIGPIANLFHDVHPTSVGAMPGPEFHLNVVGAALRGAMLKETGALADGLLIVGAGIVAWLLASAFRHPLRRALAGVGAAVAYCVACQILYDVAGVVVLASAPVLVLALSNINIFIYDIVLERREKARVRTTLERYVSKDVVRELLDNPQTYFNALNGVRRPVTVLFSDIRGFTTLTESADSSRLVQQLNEYLDFMVAHVFEHQGTLDKFIGDAVMAVWGNIVSQGPERDALNAVATALAMRQSLRKLNEDWKQRGLPELAFGIGINQGEVIVGNLGSSQKMELTVIGDAVNLASRLEGATKEYHLDLLLGENAAALVGKQYLLRRVDLTQVKGKTRPVELFTVMGDGAGQTVSLPLWMARYEDGVQLYRQREFSPAAAAFQECLRRQPDDYLSLMYAQRCEALLREPPDESWDGVFVMTKK